MLACGGGSSNTLDVGENTLCGGTSLTRSGLMSAMAVAAGIALGPRQAVAATGNASEPSVGASDGPMVALSSQDSGGETVEGAGATYTVGADEVSSNNAQDLR